LARGSHRLKNQQLRDKIVFPFSFTAFPFPANLFTWTPINWL
jgi:hypothetical protein